MDLLSIYAPANRTKLVILAGVIIGVTAFVDWLTPPIISLGFLYLIPIMILGGFFSRIQVVGVALGCAVLRTVFLGPIESEAGISLLIQAWAGFSFTGLFISEMVKSRRIHEEGEEQLRMLVESSPAAVVTVDTAGVIVLANEAAQRLFAPGSDPIIGKPIAEFLPALHTAVHTQRSQSFRTELQCRGNRTNGETFLAAIWFSTYSIGSGFRLAAIVVDLSEDLRDREDLSLDHLLKNARILMGAVSHEIRNVCGAVLATHRNLSRVSGLKDNDDFQALGTLIGSLEKLSRMELRSSTDQTPASIDLSTVLDELRIILEPSYREMGMDIRWELDEGPLPVLGEHYGLQQVFLNLARNSQRAMEKTKHKRLTIRSAIERDSVIIRFEDTGVGIPSPNGLFGSFYQGAEGTGLGLYISRALLRSFRGDLHFEQRTEGCCFAITLVRAGSGSKLENVPAPAAVSGEKTPQLST